MTIGGNPSDVTTESRTAWYQQPIVVILVLIFFYPVGLFLMWKFAGWSRRIKFLVTIVPILLFILMIWIGEHAPPTLHFDNIKKDKASTEDAHYVIKGHLFSDDNNIVITANGINALRAGDSFSVDVPLAEGDNQVVVTATKKSKVSTEHLIIHRLTAAEIEAKRVAEAKKLADAEAKAAAERAAADKAAAGKTAAEKASADKAAADKAAADKAAADKTAADASKAASDKAAADQKTAADAAAAAQKAAADKAAADKVAADKAAADKAAADKAAAEEAARNAPKSSFGDGTFLVGKDIVAGRYKSQGGSLCYWERLRGTSGEFRDIIANGLESGQTIVTIAPTDAAFKTDGCGTWTKF